MSRGGRNSDAELFSSASPIALIRTRDYDAGELRERSKTGPTTSTTGSVFRRILVRCSALSLRPSRDRRDRSVLRIAKDVAFGLVFGSLLLANADTGSVADRFGLLGRMPSPHRGTDEPGR